MKILINLAQDEINLAEHHDDVELVKCFTKDDVNNSSEAIESDRKRPKLNKILISNKD